MAAFDQFRGNETRAESAFQMNMYSQEGNDLRSVIESNLRVAREIGNCEAANLLLMALLRLGPRECAREPQPAAADGCVASFIRVLARA